MSWVEAPGGVAAALNKYDCQVGAVEASDCIACFETPKERCPNSKRPCGHHCNHTWSHDKCCWCDATWEED